MLRNADSYLNWQSLINSSKIDTFGRKDARLQPFSQRWAWGSSQRPPAHCPRAPDQILDQRYAWSAIGYIGRFIRKYSNIKQQLLYSSDYIYTVPFRITQDARWNSYARIRSVENSSISMTMLSSTSTSLLDSSGNTASAFIDSSKDWQNTRRSWIFAALSWNHVDP